MERAPVLFIGHGSPLNAIETNPFTERMREMGQLYPEPRAILCVSAHWLTDGTFVTHMRKPRTIHDFYGFPHALFEVKYPAPGSAEVAERVACLIGAPRVKYDEENWGLDHGAWSVLRHLYPAANVPVVQLSMDADSSPAEHFELGKKLRGLRDEGVLIVGSGNIVHNLRQIQWGESPTPYPWAVEFDSWVAERLVERDFKSLTNDYLRTEAGKLSVPTSDHYLPMLYVLGAADDEDRLFFESEGIQNASISMRSFSFRPTTSA